MWLYQQIASTSPCAQSFMNHWGETKTEAGRTDLIVQPAPPAQASLRDYCLQSAMLLALTAAIVGMFW